MELGAVVAGGGPGDRARFATAGLDAGRAFQIADDLLDAQSDQETLGKTPGKDLKNRKLTYPSVVGVEDARRKADALILGACGQVAATDPEGRLRWLLERFINRVA